MKIRDLISSALFIAGMLLSVIGIVILEILNYREAMAYEHGFDVGVCFSVIGLVLMAVSFVIDLLPIKRKKENRADSKR